MAKINNLINVHSQSQSRTYAHTHTRPLEPLETEVKGVGASGERTWASQRVLPNVRLCGWGKGEKYLAPGYAATITVLNQPLTQKQPLTKKKGSCQ